MAPVIDSETTGSTRNRHLVAKKATKKDTDLHKNGSWKQSDEAGHFMIEHAESQAEIWESSVGTC